MTSFVVVVQPSQEIHSTQRSNPPAACSIASRNPTAGAIVAGARVHHGGRIPASRRQKVWIGMCLVNQIGAGGAEPEVPEAEALSTDIGAQ